MTSSPAEPKASMLYVDDDLENLESFKALFRRNYDVYLARSAREAIDILGRRQIQVLITDQRMPEMTGSELLEAVADQYPHMLRFMLTGFSDFDPLVTALNDGRLQGLFLKPIDAEKMESRIEQGLAEYYLEMENEMLYTSLRESERQIRTQLAELEQLYAAAPVGLALVDRNLRIVRINEKLAEIDGFSVQAHLGKSIDEVVPELSDRLDPIYQQVLQTGEPVVDIELHGTTAKQPGVERDWLGNYYPFANSDGEVIGVIVGVVEITAMRQVERTAEEARLFAENLLKTANSMIISLDNQGCIRLVNPTVEALTGYTKEELIGRNWFELVVPLETYPEVWAEFDRLIKGGLPHVFENPIKIKDGSERIISWSNSELVKNGKIIGTLSVGIDITQRKLVEKEINHLADQLRQSQKMEAIGTLAGGIAHDFNNILSPIIGYAEIIMNDVAPDSDIGNQAKEILRAGLRARDLTNQILTFSREKEQEKRPLKIQPVLKEALKLLRASLPTTIELNQRIDTSCGPILGDPTQCYQVIMNLCTNAFQAMQQQGGLIEVAVEEVSITEADQPQFMEIKPGRYVRLSVSDTGPGIDPEIMERIFDPYFTTKRMKSGTGLGLSVVHGIVKSHAGTIKVYSEPGKGTTFTIYLPRFTDHQVEPELDDQSPVPGGSESILIVDDEPAIVQVVQHQLERLGYKVTGYVDPREALSAFRTHPNAYDLILTDMTMPHMTGLELASEARTINPSIRLVVCTGFSDIINRKKITRDGIHRMVMKPIIQSEIANIIRDVLDGA
ncbi:MAG: response regulator [Desulfatitalea sp.]|nr:response regulator [Desulfatitalea sp.]NNK02886.1 response regulator [Desulfatitalea sp.]